MVNYRLFQMCINTLTRRIIHFAGTGNVSPFVTAEYNFYNDPEAAYIVFEEHKSPLIVVPWEAYFTHIADKVWSKYHMDFE